MIKILTFFILFPLFSNATEVIRIASDDWCPYACNDPLRPGYLIELAREAFQLETQIKIEFSVINWARAISETEKGEYDAVAGASKEDTPGFIFPDQPQLEIKFEFFTLSSDPWKFTGLYQGRKIGVVNGYKYDEETNRRILAKDKGITVVSGENGLDSLIPMLKKGRVDTILESGGVFREKISSYGESLNLYRSAGSPSDKPIPHFISFSPKNKKSREYTQILLRGQEKLKKSGRLKALQKKYNI